MPRDQDGISRAGDRTGRWRGRLRADWRSEGTKFGGGTVRSSESAQASLPYAARAPKTTGRSAFLSPPRAARTPRDGIRPPGPAEYAVDRRPFRLFGRLSPSHPFFHGGKNLQDDPKRELATLPARAKGKGERVRDASCMVPASYVRLPGSPTRLEALFFFYSMKVPWKVCGRAPLIITPESLSPPGAPALFVRPALLCRTQPLPPYQPTHPRGNGPSVLARLYVTVWSTATPYHPK
jgi:hypothetical protein